MTRNAGAYFLTAAAALAAVAILTRSDKALFAPYFHTLPPIVACLLVAAIGGISILGLERAARRSEAGAVELRLMKWAPVALGVFLSIAITSDIALRFGAAINAPWPQSLLFYPAMAFVAETVFHLAPLAIAAALIKRRDAPKAAPVAIFIAALIEPLFQISATLAPTWLDVVTFFNVYAFGVFTLLLLRHYGFAAAFGFRCAYYLGWHIVWGALRLDLLF